MIKKFIFLIFSYLCGLIESYLLKNVENNFFLEKRILCAYLMSCVTINRTASKGTFFRKTIQHRALKFGIKFL